jgi:hypothetical protein
VSEAKGKGWCDCSWEFPGYIDGARCATCGHIIPGVEFVKSPNAFDVLTQHGKECNARKARKALRVVN